MEIVRFKKGKSNIYELELDNGLKFKLYDDVIVKYNLLVNKRLDSKKFEEITNYNDSLMAYYEAIKKINVKMRSEKEIYEFLKKKELNNKIIEDTIEKLKIDGYLNRDLYIKAYINDAYRFNNDGPYKIKNNLIKQGFKEEEIDKYLNIDFKEKAYKLIDKKVKCNNKYSNYLLKHQINNYMINLGYPKEIYFDYLDNIRISDKSIIKKETEKLIKKYQKKYENNDLKYFIKDKLYKKGYNSEEISEVLKNVFL